MSSAGQRLVAGRIPSERIATTVVTSNSSAVTTTETAVISVTAPLVAGRTYRVTADFGFNLSAQDALFDVRLREDSATGAQKQRKVAEADSTVSFWPFHIEVEFTAGSNVNKTFVVTFDRQSGSGSMTLNGAGSAPAYMYVDYISG